MWLTIPSVKAVKCHLTTNKLAQDHYAHINKNQAVFKQLTHPHLKGGCLAGRDVLFYFPVLFWFVCHLTYHVYWSHVTWWYQPERQLNVTVTFFYLFILLQPIVLVCPWWLVNMSTYKLTVCYWMMFESRYFRLESDSDSRGSLAPLSFSSFLLGMSGSFSDGTCCTCILNYVLRLVGVFKPCANFNLIIQYHEHQFVVTWVQALPPRHWLSVQRCFLEIRMEFWTF